MATISPNSKEIIKLLSDLKIQTPDYPVEMLAARKIAFLNKAAAIKIQIKGPGGGEGQSGTGGGTGSPLGGSTASPGIGFQALMGFGLVTAMLIGAFIFSDYDTNSHDEPIVAAAQETTDTSLLPLTGGAPLTLTPVPAGAVTPTVVLTDETTDSTQTNYTVIDEIFFDEIAELKKEKKPNPGLHLGQADGTPAAPGQGNPGNINQPDKPGKPEKPKNENSNKPPKPE